jgi:tetratricopeptide (TPR) repeat protein
MRPETLYKVLPWKATDFWDGRAKSFLFESEKDLTKRPEKTGRLLQSAVSEYESAKELLQQRLSRETGTVKVADLVLQVARAARKAGRNVEARQQAESAVAQFRTLGEKKKLAEALAALAFVENDLGNPVQALQHHQQALEIYRELKDRQGEANQLGNIGLIYSDLDEPQKALKYHQEALQIQRELGNLPEVARQLGNIAESYLQENDFQKAGAAIAEALSLQGIEQFKSLHTWLLELKEKAGRQGANEPKKTRSQIAKGRQRRS